MGLYLDSLRENFPDYIVNIMWPQNAPHRRTLEGLFVPTDATSISIGTSADIDRDLLTGGTIDGLKKFAEQSVKSIAGRLLGGDNQLINSAIDQYSVSLRQTIKGWVNGSSAYSFGVNFIVIQTGKDGIGTCSSYRNLVETVSSLTTTASDLKSVIQEPEWLSRKDWWSATNTSVTDESALNGYTFCVQIGEWFLCPRLIPTSAEIEFSKYLNADGVPQYAKVSLRFTTYRNLNFKELSEIIIK